MMMDSDPVPYAPVPAQDQDAGQALFSPFAGIGVVVQQPAAPPPPPPDGSWSIPLAAAIAGLVLIGWMLRQMVQ